MPHGRDTILMTPIPKAWIRSLSSDRDTILIMPSRKDYRRMDKDGQMGLSRSTRPQAGHQSAQRGAPPSTPPARARPRSSRTWSALIDLGPVDAVREVVLAAAAAAIAATGAGPEETLFVVRLAAPIAVVVALVAAPLSSWTCRRRPCSSVASWSSRASWRPCW